MKELVDVMELRRRIGFELSCEFVWSWLLISCFVCMKCYSFLLQWKYGDKALQEFSTTLQYILKYEIHINVLFTIEKGL